MIKKPPEFGGFLLCLNKNKKCKTNTILSNENNKINIDKGE